MKCTRCGHRYAANAKANLGEKYAPPGKLLIATIAFVTATAFLGQRAFDLWFGISVVATLICIYSLWESWALAKSQNPNCPECNCPNPVHPWSF